VGREIRTGTEEYFFFSQATDDKNKDGYIDYPEFVQAQQAAMARQAQPMK
jgi:hypothetical protein